MLALFLEYVICIIMALQQVEKDKQTTHITWDKFSFITQCCEFFFQPKPCFHRPTNKTFLLPKLNQTASEK